MTNESSIDRDWAARFEILIGQAPGDTDEDAGSQFSVLLGDVIELLMPAEMAQADKMTIEAGTTGMALIFGKKGRRAGQRRSRTNSMDGACPPWLASTDERTCK